MSEPFSVVLAGGGVRTFWGMGVLRSIADLLPPIDHYAGVSAGAAMSAVLVSDRVDASLEYFLTAIRANPRNFYPGRLLRGDRAFPHEAMLRRTMDFVLDEGGFERVKRGPPIHILLSFIPAGRPTLRTGLAAFRAFDRRARSGRLHGPSRPAAGLGVQVVSSHDAADPQQLIDWVVMSSSTPPVTRILQREGRRYVDGALVDNIPIRALPSRARAGKVLVLLASPKKVARRPLRTVEGGSLLYLAPADDPPTTMWDYTSAQRILDTWELGQREGRVLRKRVMALLESPAP